MGQSADGILFFGYAHDLEGLLPYDQDEDESDWEERYLERKHQLHHPGYHDKEAHRLYYEKRHELLGQCPVGIDTHCSGECPMPFIYIRDSKITASQGYPERIHVNLLGPESGAYVDWINQLEEFCKLMDIDIEKMGEVGWYLVSDCN